MSIRSLAGRIVVSSAMLVGLLPSDANAQALTPISMLRTGYVTIKAKTKPDGDLKAHIEAIDREIAEATRLGRNSDLRRLFTKGFTLLTGQPWTLQADYNTSLVLRTDRVVADSLMPFVARLEQLYQPAIELTRSLGARVTLRKPQTGFPGAPGPLPEIVKAFGTMDGVSRDLRESPFAIELDVSDIPNGPYLLAVEVIDQDAALGVATLSISLHKGLDAAASRLSGLSVPPAVRPAVLFPFDRIRNVNRGRLPLGAFNIASEIASAEKIAAAAGDGKDPYAGRTGDMERHYLLEAAGEIMPYRLYVPTSYNGSRAYPLIIALHGQGGTEDTLFERYDGELTKLAERHGYIVAAPFGYRVDGGYGWGLGNPPEDVITRRRQELSEQDVMQVLGLVSRQYTVDPRRTYLMGHSMGAIGTWRIAAKYPDLWAGLGMIAGNGPAATQQQMRRIPQIVVHGDADPTVSVSGSRTMVEALKKLGGDVVYIEVPGGGHVDVVAPNLSKIFEFFNARVK
jgi:poly(3-hydroxybutyrate) depolymerase